MSEETPKMFSLKLSGEGMNVEQQIDQRSALQVLQVVMGGGLPAPVAVAANDAAPAQAAPGVALSLREYLDKHNAKMKPDQIATIAQYVCDVEGQPDFGREDIKSRFITAREPLPSNFSRDFNIAIERGWIAPVLNKRDRLYVTAKGAQAINSNFSTGKGAAARR
jgi:hypothetical protein